MRSIVLLVLIICVALVSAGVTAVLYANWYTLDTITLYAELQVSDSVGFNADTDGLFFGRGLQGGGVTRSVDIRNVYGTPIRVYVLAGGPIAQFISVEQPIELDTGESKRVDVAALIPADTPFGNYTGAVSFFYRRAQ